MAAMRARTRHKIPGYSKLCILSCDVPEQMLPAYTKDSSKAHSTLVLRKQLLRIRKHNSTYRYHSGVNWGFRGNDLQNFQGVAWVRVGSTLPL